MTEKRKQYLTSISKEERAIRNQIDYHKSSLKMRKWLIKGNKDEDSISLPKSEIAEIKVIIKVLKKQLPAPMKKCNSYVEGTYFKCICCNFPTHITQPYCDNCGQKLR